MSDTSEPQELTERRQAHPYGRRADDGRPRSEFLEILMQIRANQLELDHKLSEHIKHETAEIAAEMSKCLASAFPGGDPDGHRRHHEALIEKAQSSAAFWKDLRNSTAKWGLLGFLGWVVLSLWSQFLQGPGK